MKTAKIRDALNWVRSGEGSLGDKFADDAEEELRELEALARVSSAHLRDTFAAAALTGLLANQSLRGELCAFARDAYRVADAMLAAREGK